MHGGKMFLRGECKCINFPKNVHAKPADQEDLAEIIPYIKEFCVHFNADEKEILNSEFTVITPDSNNPYKQMYVAN
ncbi:MAG: hypothetical protein J5911_04965 [Clostridia bacterium]|nr:hypothetical protein [Clostridia bacterium]